MKLRSKIAGKDHVLELERDGGRVMATIDDRRYELEARELEPGMYLLQLGARVYECRVRRVDAARGSTSEVDIEVDIGQQVFQITLIDPKRLRSSQRAGAQADGSARITAPMPGRVVRVLVELGAQVQVGTGLVVVEAMKMQNEMKSPRAGVVTSLSAEPGSTVNAGDVLVVIE
ncbi:MAG TPA: biotin/lipoyl-containing protein [Pyrinomonadaceae bacterium]|jgi:biotin carboxyl carrier protein